MNLKKKLLKSTLIIILLVLIINVGPMVEKVKAELANTPWPMFHHDLKHTGQSPYLGAQDNNLKWSYTTGDAILSSPAIGSDGTIYVGSYDKKLYAINKDGTSKWSYTTGSYIESSPAIGSDGTIYVGSYDHNLYAINQNGTLKWSYTTGNAIYSSPAIGIDGTIYVGSDDGKLYAIDPDGTFKWSYTTGGYIESSPAIGIDGTIYVGSFDKKLYAIDPYGTFKWSYTTGSYILSSPAIGIDGTIYVGSYDDKLYAINPDGTFKWSYTTGGYILSSPAIGSDGTIYVGSFDHNLYAIDPYGTFKWSYTTGGYIESSPAIGIDGTIYVGSYNKNLYAINQNGTSKWSYTTGAIIISSPAIGSDGTIYVGSFDDKLYAIGTITITFDTIPSNTGTITFDSVIYSDGDSASKPPNIYNISANPATGYKFVKWEVEGSITVDDPYSSNTTCTISGDGTLRMVQTINQYTVTVNINPSGSGSVTKNPDQPSYDHGTDVQLTPNPSTGYHFVNWSGDIPSGHENDNPLTITMDSNKTLTANFATNTYIIKATSGPNGSINPSGDIIVTHGDDQTFNFYPDTGYRIADVLVDGISVGKPNSYTFFNVTTNHTIHVEFEVDSTSFFDTKSGAGIYIDLTSPLAPRWRITIPSKGYDTGWMSFNRYTKTNNHFWGEYADTRYHLIIDFYSSGRYHIIFDDRVTGISIKIAN